MKTKPGSRAKDSPPPGPALPASAYRPGPGPDAGGAAAGPPGTARGTNPAVPARPRRCNAPSPVAGAAMAGGRHRPRSRARPCVPGQRNPAAVAAGDASPAAEEPWILPVRVGDGGDLRQAQFLALVDVGRAGQGEQQQGRGPGAASPGRRPGRPGQSAWPPCPAGSPRPGGTGSPGGPRRGCRSPMARGTRRSARVPSRSRRAVRSPASLATIRRKLKTWGRGPRPGRA